MTENQSNLIVKNPNTKKAVAALRKYAKIESELKAAEKEAKEATETLKQAMIDAGVERIELDPTLTGVEGYITLAERISYKLDEDTDIGEIEAEYTKPTLDTEKVKAQYTLTGELPKGIAEARTRYITKKIKVVE